MSEVRTFVLDTNVLLHDPNALSVFKRNDIVIPMAVIEEIDKFKKDVNERGRNARQTSRLLDEMRQKGSLREGVELPSGGTIRVDHQLEDITITWGIDNNDNRILQTALRLHNLAPGSVALVTRDTNMRLKCDALGVPAEDYENAHLQIDEQYSGVSEIVVEAELIARIYAEGAVSTSYALGFLPQSFVILRSDLDEASTAMVRVSGDCSRFKLVPRFKEGIWGVMPRNKEQLFALDLLMDPAIKLVTINGQAGTGKTLLAIAAGLKQVCDVNLYRKMLVSRPIFPLGKDIGFLPGDIGEKLNPWMQPIFDNLEFLLSGSPAKGAKDHSRSREPVYQYLLDQKIIEVEPLTYIRGRSIPQQFLVVDECFPYETPVVTEEGQREIGGLFSKWIREGVLPRVKSFDTQTNTFVWKEVTNMWHRGKKALVEVQASNRKIKCTPNHLFLTSVGWVRACDLVEGDMLVASHPEECQVLKKLNPDQEQLFLGSYLGDGGFDSFGLNRTRLSVNHGMAQEEYCKWKASMFYTETHPVLNSGYNPHEPKVGFCTKAYGYPIHFESPKQVCPQAILDALDVKGLAVWFMDDGSAYSGQNGGSFHTESFDMDSVDRMIQTLQRFGLEAKLGDYSKGPVLKIAKEAYLQLCSLIAPWVHPNLAYKIHDDYKHLVGTGVWDSSEAEHGYVVVKKVTPLETEEHVFDMEVADTHNFIVPSRSRGKFGGSGGVVVHNCQNLTPHEVKTILTRAGEGAKIVFTGDPQQIDNPHMDELSNGLTYAIERFKGEAIAGHVTLRKGERSELAELAAKLL